ncbi:DUF4031 domain-containing protein [Xylanimonas sp. McL0601]|uniref:DUF4031 domain-containing protein n=1 Tax=Xylanimonas sp. McL0601 TaxID=3414739 RepID=UPI003CF17B81
MLLDPPAWPAHGTLWSHLISDTSLHELRTFARAAGLADRGLDLDHYDAPARRHEDLLAAGATAVDGRTLARRLATSGLRVPGHERAGAKRVALLTRWQTLWEQEAGLPDAPESQDLYPQIRAVGEELVLRWGEPHRVYHGRLHLTASLDALDALLAAAAGSPAEARTARLALWFHDAVHDGEAERDEERSASFAAELLAPAAEVGLVTPAEVDEVARLVLLTASHDPAATDRLGALVSDADLAILGAPPGRYARYVQQVRAEYAEVPEARFRAGRAAVLDQLLALPTLFRTEAARAQWATQASANLSGELHSLRR